MDAALENILNHEIPYRLSAIDVFTIAANYRLSWFEPKAVKIYFDDKLAICRTNGTEVINV